MAQSVLSFAVCVLAFTACTGSSVPSDPSNHRHHHGHRHHHHHNSQDQPQVDVVDAVKNDTVDKLAGEEDAVGKVHKTDQDAKRNGGRDELTTEAILPEGWSTPAAFLPPTTKAASQHVDTDDSPGDLHRDHRQQHVDNAGKMSRRRERLDHRHQQSLHAAEHKPLSHSDTQASKDETLQLPSDRELGYNTDDDEAFALQDHVPEDLVTTTATATVSVSPINMQDDSSSDKRRNRELPGKYNHNKLVNRPRWYIRRGKEENNGDNEKITRPKTYQKTSTNAHSRADRLGSKNNTDELKSSKRQKPNRRRNRPRWKNSNSEGQTDEISPKSTDHAKLILNETDNRNGSDHAIDMKKNKTDDEENGGNKHTAVNKKQTLQKIPTKGKIKECVGCSKLEVKIAEARELHKQVLKAQLLDKLRLVPTFKKRPLPPKLPEQVFPDPPQRDQTGYEDRYYAKPTQLLVFGRDLGPRHRLRKARTGSYQFGVTGKVKGDVTSADLWVYKMKDANDMHDQTLVVTDLHFSKRQRLRERSLVARLDTRVEEGWVRFDVTRVVHRWLKNKTPTSLQMLAIRCKTCRRESYRAIFGVKSKFRPVLVVHENRGESGHRNKRAACDPNTGCCKFELTVRFRDLGIHEIFHPRSIRADYCYGTCERPDAFHYNHTLIMQRMRYGSYVPVSEAMRERVKPCCVPVVLREASIMYYINDGLDTQVSVVPNLLVDKCGCA